MAARPKPAFWVAVALVVVALVGFSIYRSGVFTSIEGVSLPGVSGEALEIEFYTSSAKKNWIDRMVEEYNAAGHKVGGNTVRIKQTHVNSGTSLDELKEGKIRPDIWSPGDESWLQMGQAHWRDVKQKQLYDTYYPLVDIPLVIAMWEPMARELGYPKPIGWGDIATVAANPKGWAAYGHPEWGKFRWGHAHPDANSGFLSVVSEVYAALNKTDGIMAKDLKNPRVVSFLREFEGAVEHYGLSNSWIDDLMHIKGPSYLSCAVQYENTIIQSNEKYGNKPFKLVAVYPTEGNFWTQHPAAIINEEWVTPEKREAAKAFIDFLLSKESQTKAMRMGLRPIVKDIALEAPFDEEHGIKVDVTAAKSFTVPDEAVLKRIRDLWEDVKVPATVVMVIDRSGSMKGEPMDGAKAGAVEFIKSMKPRDKLMVMVFNNGVSKLSGLCTVRDCGEQSISKIEGIFAEGGTALHEVVVRSYAEMKRLISAEPDRRYAILLLSDGRDTSSKMSRNDFLDTLPHGEEYDVPKIYSIAYGPEADKDLLSEVSNRTNARVFSSSASEITKTYKELSANF